MEVPQIAHHAQYPDKDPSSAVSWRSKPRQDIINVPIEKVSHFQLFKERCKIIVFFPLDDMLHNEIAFISSHRIGSLFE